MDEKEEGRQVTEQEKEQARRAANRLLTRMAVYGVLLVAVAVFVLWVFQVKLEVGEDGVAYYLAAVSPWKSTNETSVFFQGETWKGDTVQHLYVRKLMVTPSARIKAAGLTEELSAGKSDYKDIPFYSMHYTGVSKSGLERLPFGRFWIPREYLTSLIKQDGLDQDFPWLTNHLNRHWVNDTNADHQYPAQKWNRLSSIMAFLLYAPTAEARTPARQFYEYVLTNAFWGK